MSRIAAVFESKGRKALVAYVTIGYPDIEATLQAVPLLTESGADIIELGIPFSDPLADGATIQKASSEALENGVTPTKCLELAAELRHKVDVPLVFMTYYNPIYSYGVEKFCTNCKKAGVDGIIVPDLPPDEGDEIGKAAGDEALDIIYLLAPTSTAERVKAVAAKSEGFIYLVSVTGVTGARRGVPASLKDFIGRVRKATDKPLCVGFGISTPEQASQVAVLADGVIVGSRIIQLIEADPSLKQLKEFVERLRQALDKA